MITIFLKKQCHTVQYYSITVTVYHFGIAIEVYYIYNIYIIYIIKSFCNPQTKTVILYVRTLGQAKRDSYCLLYEAYKYSLDGANISFRFFKTKGAVC